MSVPERDLSAMSAGAAGAAMAAGEITSEQLVGACLEHIAGREDAVGAWIHLDPALALEQARAADERRAAGKGTGALDGIPVGLKDIFDTADMPTENGSAVHAGRRPGVDSAVAALLRRAGAVIMGKTVTTEFALSAPGKTANPLDPARTPGGSSSGSAAAVADNMVPLALGSQTGGSVLRPAAFCGVYGFKPTFGSISRAGVSPLSRRLDHVGVYGRTIDDVALIAGVLMAADDGGDRDMRAEPGLGQAAPVTDAPRLAFVRGPVWEEHAGEGLAEAFDGLRARLGNRLPEVALPDVFAGAAQCHHTVMHGSVAASLGDYYRDAPEKMRPLTRERVERGREIPAGDYIRALETAEDMQAALADFFGDYDAIVTAASAGIAPLGLERTGNPMFNGYWTLMGVPAISVPLLQGPHGLPIGVQVIRRWGEDAALLETARWLAAEAGVED